MSSKRSAKTVESLTDFPQNILLEILLRLPIESIFVARCVCKTFFNITSPNPHFIALHSPIASQLLIFQFGDIETPSLQLNLFEPELSVAPRTHENFRPKPLFQLPMIYRTDIIRYRSNYRDTNKLVLVNSCNSLLYFVRRFATDERSLVCNPVTSEYVMIPDVDTGDRATFRTGSMWLGFSPSSNSYKVVRIFRSIDGEHSDVRAQLFEVGSNSWRDVDDSPLGDGPSWSASYALLNEVIYWLDESWREIIFFDFESEKFGNIALPSEYGDEQLRGRNGMHPIRIGSLAGCLSLSYSDYNAQRVDIWIMKGNGDQRSWRKEFVVDVSNSRHVYGQFRPLQILRNGEILMHLIGKDMVCYDPRKKSLRFLDLFRLQMSSHRVVPLIPSFLSLKEYFPVQKVILQRQRPRVDRRYL